MTFDEVKPIAAYAKAAADHVDVLMLEVKQTGLEAKKVAVREAVNAIADYCGTFSGDAADSCFKTADAASSAFLNYNTDSCFMMLESSSGPPDAADQDRK